MRLIQEAGATFANLAAMTDPDIMHRLLNRASKVIELVNGGQAQFSQLKSMDKDQFYTVLNNPSSAESHAILNSSSAAGGTVSVFLNQGGTHDNSNHAADGPTV